MDIGKREWTRGASCRMHVSANALSFLVHAVTVWCVSRMDNAVSQACGPFMLPTDSFPMPYAVHQLESWQEENTPKSTSAADAPPVLALPLIACVYAISFCGVRCCLFLFL